jgi:hypothetical protein
MVTTLELLNVCIRIKNCQHVLDEVFISFNLICMGSIRIYIHILET